MQKRTDDLNMAVKERRDLTIERLKRAGIAAIERNEPGICLLLVSEWRERQVKLDALENHGHPDVIGSKCESC